MSGVSVRGLSTALALKEFKEIQCGSSSILAARLTALQERVAVVVEATLTTGSLFPWIWR
jgi:hypothetical protein